MMYNELNFNTISPIACKIPLDSCSKVEKTNVDQIFGIKPRETITIYIFTMRFSI